MAITLIPSSNKQTQHIVFEGVTWATYQALLHDLGITDLRGLLMIVEL